MFGLSNLQLVLIIIALIIVVYNKQIFAIERLNGVFELFNNNLIVLAVIAGIIYYFTIDAISALIIAFIFVFMLSYYKKNTVITNVIETLEAFGI